MLMYLPKIPEVKQSIGFGLATIIQDNDNNNIRFYLQDIIQAYIEIALDLNPDFYIRPFSELILQLSAIFNSIIKAMRPLYGKPKANKHQFAIYYPHYKEKPRIIESEYNYHLVPYLTTMVREISQQPFFLLTMAVPTLLN